MKTELEDLSFRYLYPEQYYDIAEKVASKKRERENFIREVIKILDELLLEHGIEAEIHGRPSTSGASTARCATSRSSSTRSMTCWVPHDRPREGAVLRGAGLIHNLWKPIPGRFKDYIAIPKPNGYQSLHTSVIGPYQERIEIQIRTFEMHKIAEEGIAAHWLYKEGKAVPDKDDAKFAWLHRLMEEHQDNEDPREFLESVKIDLFHDEVYVFTPEGDVMGLPQGRPASTSRTHIHTEVGHHCAGAKVNGQIVPLATSSERRHGRDSDQQEPEAQQGLARVRQDGARAHQDSQPVRKEQRERSRELGRELLDKELKKHNTNIRAAERKGIARRGRRGESFTSIEEMLADIGYGKSQPEHVAEKMFPEEARTTKRRRRKEGVQARASSGRRSPRWAAEVAGRRPRRHRRHHGQLRQVLQPGTRRRHHRVCDARSRADRPPARAAPHRAPGEGAPDRRASWDDDAAKTTR